MTRKKSPTANKTSTRGLTLIESAAAIVVTGMLAVGATTLIKSYMDRNAQQVSEDRLSAIQQALTNYKMQNGRFPCPSSFISPTSLPTYGREIVPSCTGYAADNINTFSATGRSGSTDGTGTTIVNSPPIIIGALPVRDLELPDTYRANPAGFMYVYALTQSEATALNNFGGAIDVVDENNNTVLPRGTETPVSSHGTAKYVVVDPGKDGKGAFIPTSTTLLPGKPPSFACNSGMDQLNCSFLPGATPGKATPFAFRNQPVSKQSGANWFDDTVAYEASIPLGTPPKCTTVYSGVVAAAGTSPGSYRGGPDAGGGVGVGFVVIYVFAYADVFRVDQYFAPTYNGISPTSDAYCSDPGYNVVGGGCSQTLGAPTYNTNTGSVTNTHVSDVNFGGTSAFFNYYQWVVPVYSHPALTTAAGLQGWECNGSSAKGMQSQAYAVCCLP